MRYRIREATVDWGSHHDRAFIAERQVSLLWGVVKFWWPVIDAKWRPKRQDAETDMHRDRVLRSSVQEPREFEL